jgi:hypothetical protein
MPMENGETPLVKDHQVKDIYPWHMAFDFEKKIKWASKESVQMAQDQFLAFCRPTVTRILSNLSDKKSATARQIYGSIHLHSKKL